MKIKLWVISTVFMISLSSVMGALQKIGPKLTPQMKKQLDRIVMKDANTTVPMEQFLKKYHEHEEKDPYFVTFRCSKSSTRTRCRVIDYKVPLKPTK